MDSLFLFPSNLPKADGPASFCTPTEPFPCVYSKTRGIKDVISIYYRELVFMKIVHIITMRRKIMSESLILRLIKKIRLS